MGRYEADHILFGAAYYDEYLMMKGIDRIDEDMAMMKDAGLNVIRIAESTWSTCEPQPGVFDFTYVDRALDAAQRAGIDVIVGTPTYAVPSWLVKLDPSVLAVTPNGQGKYGARQIMDIVNATYRFCGERVIRKLISHVADHPAVIGRWTTRRNTTIPSPRTCSACSSSICARSSTAIWTSSTTTSASTTGPTASTPGRTSRT